MKTIQNNLKNKRPNNKQYEKQNLNYMKTI